MKGVIIAQAQMKPIVFLVIIPKVFILKSPMIIKFAILKMKLKKGIISKKI